MRSISLSMPSAEGGAVRVDIAVLPVAWPGRVACLCLDLRSSVNDEAHAREDGRPAHAHPWAIREAAILAVPGYDGQGIGQLSRGVGGPHGETGSFALPRAVCTIRHADRLVRRRVERERV